MLTAINPSKSFRKIMGVLVPQKVEKTVAHKRSDTLRSVFNASLVSTKRFKLTTAQFHEFKTTRNCALRILANSIVNNFNEKVVFLYQDIEVASFEPRR